MQTVRRTIGFIILLTWMLVPSPMMAQGAAEVWLNKATEKFMNKGSEISFRINEEGMHLGGKLLIDGEKFFYDTEDMKIWYDGTTQWTLQMGSGYNELYVNNPTPEEQRNINPYMLLCNYKEHFTIADGGCKNNGKPSHKVIMTVNDKSQEPASINIYLDSEATLTAIEFIASDQACYKIEVRSMRNGLTFPKDTFTYPEKEYPADEVIDMR
jgi:hypothetical protein